MADSKITALTALTAADPANDMMPIVDVSDTSMAASGTTKRISINNILACSPTATLASATITGDLTVDTSTLKVDSANNRVGVGTASPATILHIQDASTLYQTIQTASGGAGTNYKRTGSTGATDWLVGHGAASASNKFEIFNSGSSGFEITSNNQLRYAISTLGVHAWSFVGGVSGDAMTLNSTGLGIGVTPSAGKGCLQLSSGINFPATQVASSDANTLDDYEEGTWTPTIKGTSTAGTGTYSIQVGTYTKVGRVVHFQGRIAWSAHTGTGDMQIAGIPFTSLSTSNSQSVCNFGYVNGIALTASNVITGFIVPGTNDIGLYQYPVGGGTAGSVAIDTAAEIIISGTYFV